MTQQINNEWQIKEAASNLALLMSNQGGDNYDDVVKKIIQKINETKDIMDKTEWPRVISMIFGFLIEENYELAPIAPYCHLLEEFDQYKLFDFGAMQKCCELENIPAVREVLNLFPGTELGQLSKRLGY